LASRNIPLFNERFINKREMYNWLLEDSRTHDLIPVTERLRTSAGLERFCKSHPLVFLKPTGGSLGMGILKVSRKQGQFLVRYRRQKEHLTAKFWRGEELLRFVKATNPNRIYLMQQGIRLMSYQGNPTDFRVHLHKTAQGDWEAAGIGAKVAGRGAVTTHVHNGGKVVAGDKVLAEWYGGNADAMREKMVEASVRVAEVLEGYLAGSSGEWGLDVGIDVEGRVWVFEANAKPGRAIFRHPELREAGKRSARLMVEYAASLAGYPLATRG
ncbi:MAG: YheC/YheD family endospore coat-associated protein, partial [Tumebacillaceae bacterium]